MTLVALSMLATAPTGGAHHDDEACPIQAHPNATPILDDRYVVVTPGNPRFQTVMTLWEETNEMPGLQTWWTSCHWDSDPIEPDRLIAAVGGVGGPIPL